VTKKINEGFGTSQVAVTAAASKIVTGQSGTDTVTLYNTGTTTAYVGAGSGVTSTTGFPIVAGAALVMEATVDIYAITASGSTTIAILVEG
jgi:hypothetical protein